MATPSILSDLLDHASVTWTTPFEEATWTEAEALGRVLPAPAGVEGLSVITLGPALPPTPADAFLLRVGLVHRIEKGTVDWQVSVDLAPDTTPPPSFQEQNARLGGRSGLLGFLSSRTGATVAHYHACLLLERSGWTSSLLPRKVAPSTGEAAALSIASGATLEQIGFRLEDGANGLSEVAIVYLHEADMFSLTLEAKGVPEFVADDVLRMPLLESACRLAVHTFFAHVPGAVDA